MRNSTKAKKVVFEGYSFAGAPDQIRIKVSLDVGGLPVGVGSAECLDKAVAQLLVAEGRERVCELASIVAEILLDTIGLPRQSTIEDFVQ